MGVRVGSGHAAWATVFCASVELICRLLAGKETGDVLAETLGNGS